jgi:uncharacterized protein YdhG (YjbR/CyaY superfamily)
MTTSTRIKFNTVEQYLSALPGNSKDILQELRDAIQSAAPQAEEVISYNIPAFRLGGMLVWYAAFKNHVGLYPRASGIAAFKKELSAYVGAKGSVQFPIDEPLPLGLIRKIVKFRVKENLEETEAKAIRIKRK